MDHRIETAKKFEEFKKIAISSIKECFFPGCTSESINSHILQRNGAMKPIVENGYVKEIGLNLFREPPMFFKETAAKKAFSFNCFCSDHDNKLFEPIEQKDIDFNSYRNTVLFLVRAKIYERFKKMVNVNIYDQLILDSKSSENTKHYEKIKEQEILGLADIDKTLPLIWKDIDQKTESFEIKYRLLDQEPICLASFFDYETTLEIEEYFKKNGHHIPHLTSIFISLFPYKDKSVLLMGYEKGGNANVGAYVSRFMNESEKRVKRLISNLIIFHCETWIISEQFYNQRIKPCSEFFEIAFRYAYFNNFNERRNYDINIFQNNFCTKAKNWLAENVKE